MKVDSRQSATDIATDQSKRSTSAQPATDEPLPLPGNRSFSSILDSVTGAGSERRAEPAESRDTPKPEKVERSDDDRDRFQPNDPTSAAAAPLIRIVDKPALLDVQAAPPAREILPAADLQNLLMTVETQLIGAATTQVTVDLPRSVFSGLRVQLSTDRSGRISAEFITNSDSVRAHLNARSPDLVDLLRFRGLDLSEVKTSLSTDLSGRNSSESRKPVEIAAVSQKAAATAKVPESDGDVSTEPGNPLTYRA